MTDPQQHAERGLRATVRMAAGINTGDRPDRDDRLAAIFARARSLLTGRFSSPSSLRERLAFGGFGTIDRRLAVSLWRHGLGGAAVGAGFIGCSFVGIAAHAALSAAPEPPPPPIAMALVEAIAKTDRLAVGGREAMLTTASLPEPAVASDITITTKLASLDTTLAMPALAYASSQLRTDAVGAIDRALAPTLEPAPIAAVPPSATVGDEEPDDEHVVPIALPMPRAMPAHEPIVLPLPKPRPLALAALTQTTGTPPDAEPEARPLPVSRTSAPAPATSEPPGVLGFFSSPTDPVKPPGKTTIETPFGVPYVLQTGSVDTACLKPELVDILRHIEKHYHQKVVITSGFRDRGRQGSLHRQCAAADIQVPGVSADQLATFARTIPNIGGVGTYCYPMLIHVDIGTPRDWKYGCGSFFAMRGGPGHWGKVPGNLAKAQTGAPATTATDAGEED